MSMTGPNSDSELVMELIEARRKPSEYDRMRPRSYGPSQRNGELDASIAQEDDGYDS